MVGQCCCAAALVPHEPQRICATKRVFAEHLLPQTCLFCGGVSSKDTIACSRLVRRLTSGSPTCMFTCSQLTSAIRVYRSFAVWILLPDTGYESKTLGILWRRPWRAIGAVMNAGRVANRHGLTDHSPSTPPALRSSTPHHRPSPDRPWESGHLLRPVDRDWPVVFNAVFDTLLVEAPQRYRA